MKKFDPRKPEARFLGNIPYCFAQPADRAARIWRYMDLARFTNMLFRRALFFSRVDRLGDSWEGSFPVLSVDEAFEEIAVEARKGGEEAARKDWRAAWTEMYERDRFSMYTNCWQMSPHESRAMWERYCGGPFGVAIRSTYERFDAALPLSHHGQPLLMGVIRYGDYYSRDYKMTLTNHFEVFMSKRHYYEEEKEVRAIMNVARYDEKTASLGELVETELDILIEEVVTSPLAPEWFRDTVAETCRRFGRFEFEVTMSDLALPPRHKL